jgi:hypothetical protein
VLAVVLFSCHCGGETVGQDLVACALATLSLGWMMWSTNLMCPTLFGLCFKPPTSVGPNKDWFVVTMLGHHYNILEVKDL